MTIKKSDSTISIIMAVYNSAHYLAAAIDSILAQTLHDFEFVIVNDGSTDRSPQIISEFASKDPRIIVINQTNQGVGAATNAGIKAASGDYIAIMDADDIALPTRLEIQQNFLDAEDEIAGVGGQFLTIDTTNQVCGLDVQATSPDMIFYCNYAFFALHHPTTMVRRKAFEAVGLYLEDRSCLAPDYDIFTRMIAAGYHFANVPDVVLKWRINPTGLTHSKAISQTQSSQAIRQWGFKQLLKTDPQIALEVAKNLLMSFPQGTWFDLKIRELLPAENRAYLINALKNNETVHKPLSQLEYLILDWFDDNKHNPTSLISALYNQALPWFAHTLEQRYLLSSSPGPSFQIETSSTLAKTDQLSVLLPYTQADTDLFERIENVKECYRDAEIIIFPLGSTVQEFSPNEHKNVISLAKTDLGKSAWETALATAAGTYLAYLEPNNRYIRTSLINAINLLRGGTSLVYLPSERYYLDARDDSNRPYKNPSPQPQWSQTTLLGQNRIALSGFCQNRSLFTKIRLPLTHDDTTFSTVLAAILANRHELTVMDEVHDEFIPGISFENRILTEFKQTIVRDYFNAGLGLLPDPILIKDLTPKKAEVIAKQLDLRLQNGEFCLHRQNKTVILNFFALKVHNPLRFKLFKELVERYNTDLNNALRGQNRHTLQFFCLIYSILYRNLSRIKALYLMQLGNTQRP
ncbi:MAG: glycosyltransferase family A protein [Methylococcaceae bacterium]|jgi:glycosyltransferase involved in cell wall biosynthesis